MQGIEKRVVVTPSERARLLLSEVSKAMGKPKATIVRELLDEAVPVLETMLEALRLLETRPKAAREAMSRLATSSIHELTQAQLDLDTAMRKRPGRKPGPQPRKGAAKT